jgi:hypothetical protein
MKPMTAGHYRLITEAVADSQCPAGETPANETYVLISMQDRIKKNQFPVRGETALSALRDIYMDPTSGLFEFGSDKYVKMVFCHSEKFGRDNPERVLEMREIIEGIKEALAARGLANVSAEVEEVRSGPPDVLMGLADSRPNDKFILYTGDDDLKKYQYFKRYADNVDFAGFERFEGGMSGTEVRRLFQSDSDTEGYDAERFSSAFPQGVDSSRVRQKYRTDAGLDPLKEVKRAEKGTKEYSTYLEAMMDELKYIKSGYDSRKKASARYRKEASKIQDAYSEIRKLKRVNDKLLHSDENESFDRKSLKEWFKKDYNKRLITENAEHYKKIIPMLNSQDVPTIQQACELGETLGYFEVYSVEDYRSAIEWALLVPYKELQPFLDACTELGIDTDKPYRGEGGIFYNHPFVTIIIPKKDPRFARYKVK